MAFYYRLEKEELISSNKVLVGKRRLRNYYHLEARGRERVEQLRQEYLFLQEGIMKILNFRCDSPDN